MMQTSEIQKSSLRSDDRLLHRTPEGPCRRIGEHYASPVGLGDPRFDTRTMPTKRHVWGTRQSRRGDDPLGGFVV
jgi:hypothetical protein